MGENKLPGLTISILCGGPSKRFDGKVKAKLVFENSVLYKRLWKKIQPYGNEVFLQVAEKSGYELPGNRDIVTGAGPLGGLYSGLTVARFEWVFVMACDLPLFDPNLLGILAEQRGPNVDAIIPRWEDGHLEPLAALYRTSLLPWIEELFIQNQFQISKLYDLPARVVYVPIDSLIHTGRIQPHCFSNLNTPKQLAQLKTTAVEPRGVSPVGVSELEEG